MKTKLHSCLCPECEGMVFGLLNELRIEAEKMRRGRLILDAINDLQASIEDGDISLVKWRDSCYKHGNRVGRNALTLKRGKK